MAVPSASRFPPTRSLEPNYDQVVPSKRQRGLQVSEFEKILAEKSTKDGVNISRYPVTLPLPPYHPLTHSPLTYSSNKAEWSDNVEKLKTRLANQISSLQRSIHLHEQYLDEATPILRCLISAVKESPSQTAGVISCHGDDTTPTLEEYKGREVVLCGGTKGCSQKALPFSRCCLQHITRDEDQVLYRSCIALNTSTLTQCTHPVTDVLAKDSICMKHARTSLQLSEGTQKPRMKRSKLTSARSKVAKMVAAQKARKRAAGGSKSKTKPGGSRPKTVEILAGGATQPANAVPMATMAEDSSFPNKEVSNLSSSSWSSGESDEGEAPLVIATNNTATSAPAVPMVSMAVKTHRPRQPGPTPLDDLPTLTPQAPPLPSLQLVPPIFADLGRMIMMDEDSNSEGGGETELST